MNVYGSFDTAQYLKIIPKMARCVERKKRGGAVLKKRILKCQFGDLCIYIHKSILTVKYYTDMLQKATHSVWRRCVNGSISLCGL